MKKGQVIAIFVCIKQHVNYENYHLWRTGFGSFKVGKSKEVGAFIAAKTKQFIEMIHLEGNVDASSGWLTSFKQCHGIKEIWLHGKKLSGD